MTPSTSPGRRASITPTGSSSATERSAPGVRSSNRAVITRDRVDRRPAEGRRGRATEAPEWAWTRGLALVGPDHLDQLRDDLDRVPHDPEVRHAEDRRVGVLVDRDDPLRRLHPDDVLGRAADADGDVD